MHSRLKIKKERGEERRGKRERKMREEGANRNKESRE